MRGARDQVFVIVRAPNGDVREFPVTELAAVLGRDESADIRVEDRKVSRRHASFRVVDGELWAEDLGSVNGIRLNGKKIKGKARMGLDDVVLVGGYEVSLKRGDAAGRSDTAFPDTAQVNVDRTVRPERAAGRVVLIGQGRPVAGRRFALGLGESIIGRLDDCAVPILDGSVSRQHAKITLTALAATVTDLASSNGCFINGTRVDSADLKDGDRLRIGNIDFRVELSAGIPGRVGAVEPSRQSGTSGEARFRRGWLVAGGVSLLVAGALIYVGVTHRAQIDAALSARLGRGTPGTNDPPAKAPAAEAPSTPEPQAPMAVRTATSPFAPRRPDGQVKDLPAVDPSFDFDGFVSAKLAEAAALQAGARFVDLRSLLQLLLARDPINADARRMWREVELAEKAQAAIAEGDRLRAEGKLLPALEAYARVPAGAPGLAESVERQAQLKPLAIKRELERVARDLEKKKTWPRAHDRLVVLLGLDPTHAEAKPQLIELERKMREAGIRFTPWSSPEAGGSEAPLDPDQQEAQLAKVYDDRGLQRIAEVYASGDLANAIKRADAVARAPKTAKKQEAKEMAARLREIQTKYDRVRTEVANDPAQAWAHLMEFKKLEREVLPEGLKSYLTSELEQTIATAYAERGQAMFDQSRLESAFQAWDSGYQLSPGNPRVLAGLKKLEEIAEKAVEEAELAAQRGEKDACDRWRRITRITRSDTEAHKRARERLQRGC